MNQEKVIVIGGGASGMMAAGTAAKRGKKVILIEQNKILGKKLLITGKGRCNFTNACEDIETIISNIPTNPHFMYSALYGFTNFDTIEFFNKLSVKSKVERGNRVFPASDKSSDIVNALKKYIFDNNVEVICDRVDRVLYKEKDGQKKVNGVLCQKNGEIISGSVIIATGGMSYQKTGSCGDGYYFAEELGHTITDIRPSLVPVKVKEDYISSLMGLTLNNVGIKLKDKRNKLVYSDFGEMMFAHFGLTGPVILSMSAHMKNPKQEEYALHIDLKPALSEKQLDSRLLRDFDENKNKSFKNVIGGLLPKKMIDTFIFLAGIDPYKKTNQITKEERKTIIELLKNLTFHITDFCDIDQAIITSGGVSVKEINPSTMQSKLVDGLYFAGEIIDVDAYTGGFNLQIAFSSGFLAGSSC